MKLITKPSLTPLSCDFFNFYFFLPSNFEFGIIKIIFIILFTIFECPNILQTIFLFKKKKSSGFELFWKGIFEVMSRMYKFLGLRNVVKSIHENLLAFDFQTNFIRKRGNGNMALKLIIGLHSMRNRHFMILGIYDFWSINAANFQIVQFLKCQFQRQHDSRKVRNNWID